MGRIQRCEKKYGELFGRKPVRNEGNDPEFMRILQRFIFGEVYDIGDLGDQTRELITIVVLTANQTVPQLKAHTMAALNVGCSPIEIREAIYQCAPFIGFPKTLNAIATMNEVFTENDILLPLESQETVIEEERYLAGKRVQEPIYGSEIADKYAYLPEEYGKAIPQFLTEFCFGDFATRNGLNMVLRELLNFITLAALGGADLQVYSHAIGALKSGNRKEDLLCALIQAMPYMGFPRMLNALNAIKPLLDEK